MKSDAHVNPLPPAVSRHLAVMAALCIGVSGCAPELPGTQLSLGPVSYDKAFAAARDVMAQYFTTLDEVDREAGVIRSRPVFIEAGGFSISGSPPARRLANLTLRPDGPYVVARLTVAIQRQGSEAFRTFRARQEDYSGMGRQTPADLEAATTRRQNELWETYRYDRMLEHTILRHIANLIRPIDKPPAQP